MFKLILNYFYWASVNEFSMEGLICVLSAYFSEFKDLFLSELLIWPRKGWGCKFLVLCSWSMYVCVPWLFKISNSAVSRLCIKLICSLMTGFVWDLVGLFSSNAPWTSWIFLKLFVWDLVVICNFFRMLISWFRDTFSSVDVFGEP